MNKKTDYFMNSGDIHKYDDIINLPHHVSGTHAHMPAADRAAQFAPFAALTGHQEAVRETARHTDERIELDESCKEVLDEKLRYIREQAGERPVVTVTYFVPDDHKSGGSYVTVTGRMKKIDEYEKSLVMDDGERIWMEDIIELS